jgi:hypothetical protein
MTDEDAIRNIVNLYFQHADDNDWDAWSRLLTEDYLLDIHGHITQGREVNRLSHIESHGDKLPHGRHFGTNTVVYVDGGHARAITDWLYVAELGLPHGNKHLDVVEMGRAYDEFRREDGSWLLAKRDIRPLYMRPPASAPA